MSALCSTINKFYPKKCNIVITLFFIILIKIFDKASINKNNIKDECSASLNNFSISQNRPSTLTQSKHIINNRAIRKLDRRRRQCSFYDPLINKSNPIFCATQNFVSLVRSKCKTRLGKNEINMYSLGTPSKKKRQKE